MYNCVGIAKNSSSWGEWRGGGVRCVPHPSPSSSTLYGTLAVRSVEWSTTLYGEGHFLGHKWCIHVRVVTHTHTHTRTHARTHARTHTRTHVQCEGVDRLDVVSIINYIDMAWMLLSVCFNTSVYLPSDNSCLWQEETKSSLRNHFFFFCFLI